LKKILLYLLVAIALGLSLTLIPLITLAEIKTEDHYATFFSLPEQMEKLERSADSLDKPTYSSEGVEVFAISFIIASAVYLSLRRRTPRHDYRWIRPYP